MPYLAATTVLLAVVVLVNLTVTLRLARDVRDLRGQVAAGAAAGGPPPGMFPVGAPVRPFAVTTVDGAPLTADTLAPWTLVAVLSPDCTPCHEGLPAFLTTAREVPGGRAHVVVALADSPDGAPALVARLRDEAQVVVGDDADRLVEALSVGQFPFFAWVGPDAVVEYGGLQADLTVLPVSVWS
ncbi:TlpA family protein disulfide reductase [Cellulomonas gilvus]|uniref:Thioredoxin domain-containing protein n=1 Tax=Cellulomonas gilvus (strain ATCC 13127 / NRRL B-14078) TaxID=593907 RepID=F8A5M2_CELGA|nr:hypothetical protein [Cellulomonas gilvus]AEI12177.1 hypothetical protein Celgi_1666 [Cellulomonas gilvus ATCC 13127]